jgi:membrane protease YdiL (CAAX protease family)
MRARHREATLLAMAFAIVFPSCLTWLYFDLLERHPASIQQSAYAIGKTIQFLFPLVWVFLVLRERPSWPRPRREGLLPGAMFGGFVGLAIVVIYFAVLKPRGIFVGPDRAVQGKLMEMGLDRVWKYALVAVFYSLGHSLLEEYYWRWFVFGRLREHASLLAAALISSAGFAAHHVVLLKEYFGWESLFTYGCSLGIAVGGAVWAGIYHRSRSLYGPWLSHGLVDIAIFVLGYDLVKASFTP